VFDKLAEEGICYTHAYSVAPVCSPSRSSIVTENPRKLRSMMQGMVKELESMDAVYPVKDGQELKPIIP
jgi:hypothetical protein